MTKDEALQRIQELVEEHPLFVRDLDDDELDDLLGDAAFVREIAQIAEQALKEKP